MRGLLAKLTGLFSKKAEPSNVFVSLILLRKHYRPLLIETLQAFVRDAYNVVLDEGMPLNSVLAITPQSFLVKLGGEMLAVNNSRTPYSENPERDADSFPTVEWQQAWREHTSWISVDYVSGEQISETERLEKYPWLGRLAVHFIDEAALGLYIPGPTENDPPRFRGIDADIRGDMF